MAEHETVTKADVDGKITTHAGLPSVHHAKTGDNEVYGLLLTGTDAGKPAAGIADRWYFATDTLILYRDNGTSWVEAARGETVIRLAQLAEKIHASLTGKDADDHTQYLNTTRHDVVARHPLSVLDTAVCSETEAQRSSTLVVAANDSSAYGKALADYVCDGVNDHLEIQAAIDALPATGGEVFLLEGTYYVEVSLVLDSYQTLRGCGRNTILTTTTPNTDIPCLTSG